MQRYDQQPSKSYNTTFALAQFLTTTGPEDYSNNRISQYDHGVSFDPQTSQSLQTNKMKFFDRLRKKGNHNITKSIQQQQKLHHFPPTKKLPTSYGTPINRGHKKHIPLVDDINQPNSQIINYHIQKPPSFYETEDNYAGDTLPSFPTPPASSLHESEEHQQATPLFSSSSSSSLSESSPAYTPAHLTRSKTVTVAVNKGIRRGSRHIQVQTDDQVLKKQEDCDHPPPEKKSQPQKDRCDLCCRPLNEKHFNVRQRRLSCPAVLASGAKIKLLGHEASVLLALIDQLKQQLVEEQHSRKLLEKAIQSQWLQRN